MADIVDNDFYDLYEENLNINNENQDLMDVAMISHPENIKTQSQITNIDAAKFQTMDSASLVNNVKKMDVPILLSSYNGPKFGIYVANLSWWMTDKQICKMCRDFGINDLLEIKFFENKGTGVSKGFALLMFGSMESAQQAVSKFSTATVEGIKLISLMGTKQNYESLKQHANETYPNQSRHRTEQESAIAMQIVLKNPALVAQIVNSQQAQNVTIENNQFYSHGNNYNQKSYNNQSINHNNNSQRRQEHESTNPELFSELRMQTNEAIRLSHELSESNDIRKAIFTLMDCAEDIRQSEISKERPVKMLLDEIYDTKRMLTTKNDRKRMNRSSQHQQNDNWHSFNDNSPVNDHRKYSPRQTSRNRERDSRHRRSSSHHEYSRHTRSRSPPSSRRYR